MRAAHVWRRLWGLVGVLAAGVVIALTVDMPDREGTSRLIETTGWAAPAVFIGLYALVTLAPVPKNVLSAVAGLLFGLGYGVFLVLVAAMLGALAAFGLGRVLGRAAVERITSARVRDVDALLARRGVLAVVTVRLVPVLPFTAINYTAGLTGIRLRDYTLGTAIGILPGTVSYVTIGAYGSTPGAWPFLVSVGALFVLSAGGLVVAHRRRSSRTERDA